MTLGNTYIERVRKRKARIWRELFFIFHTFLGKVYDAHAFMP